MGDLIRYKEIIIDLRKSKPLLSEKIKNQFAALVIRFILKTHQTAMLEHAVFRFEPERICRLN